jgi:hypothetical protein
MNQETANDWRRILAQLRPRCAACGHWVGVGAQVFYPPGSAVPGMPDSGPTDPVYVCRACRGKETIVDA